MVSRSTASGQSAWPRAEPVPQIFMRYDSDIMLSGRPVEELIRRASL